MKKVWYLKNTDQNDQRVVKLFVYEVENHAAAYMDLSAFANIYHGQDIEISFLFSNNKERQFCVQNFFDEQIALQKIAIPSDLAEVLASREYSYDLMLSMGDTIYNSEMQNKNQKSLDIEATADDVTFDEESESVPAKENIRKIVELNVLEEEMTFRNFLHNSFLLHGYYNYGHVVIEQKDGLMRLGVPGNYYERELMVAKMFGFPYFEAAKEEMQQNGTFGYFFTEGNS